jgi:DNA replication and repair protein RecF
LEESRPDPHWLDAIEHETAEVAVAVAGQRAETVARLQQVLAARDDPGSVFPASEIALKGWIEELIRQRPALEVEDHYRAVLRDNRARDAAAGRTLDGPHLTDLAVTHARKRIPAADASTGEQKALLIGLVLAHASLLAEMSGFAPILLLDEVVAHLDPARRTALYNELEQLGAQVWMTGADPAAFTEIEARAQVFEVSPGRVARKPG